MERIRGLAVAALLIAAVSAGAQDAADGLGFRGGIGTDITFGGVAFGAGVNKLFGENLEIGLVLYYGSFEETTVEGNTYIETTEITAFAAFLNYLYGYRPGQDGFFFVGGVGLAYLGVYWEQKSPDDTSLGTPWTTGSKQDFEGGLGGTLINLGAGYGFAGGLDLRLEIPIVFAFGDVGEASTIVPLFTLTAGYRLGS